MGYFCSMPTESAKDLFRHTLATLAYRGGKAFRGAPEEFGDFEIGGKSAGKILAHIGDLLDWALTLAKNQQVWKETAPQGWRQDVERFQAGLAALDAYVAAGAAEAPLDKLFQGPVADALTHVGQIAMMRRLADCPLKGENYFRADISIGRL